MRYLDLPVGAVLLDEDDSVDLVLGWKNGCTMRFADLLTGRVFSCRFMDDEVIPDHEVLLPEGT